jgi:hypothetical protein
VHAHRQRRAAARSVRASAGRRSRVSPTHGKRHSRARPSAGRALFADRDRPSGRAGTSHAGRRATNGHTGRRRLSTQQRRPAQPGASASPTYFSSAFAPFLASLGRTHHSSARRTNVPQRATTEPRGRRRLQQLLRSARQAQLRVRIGRGFALARALAGAATVSEHVRERVGCQRCVPVASGSAHGANVADAAAGARLSA